MALLGRHLKIAGGLATYCVGTYAAYEYFRPVPPLPSCKDRCCTFNQLAPNYDKEIEKDESTSGIMDMRKAMIAQASGSVLEVAGGTGRNLSFYGDGVKSLLITDYSESMLQVAARKVAEVRKAAATSAAGASSSPSTAAGPLSNVTLAVTDAAKLELPSASFDTVVDTFGICSFEEPEAALHEMRRCCKPGGKVLLLEHGVSDWSLLAKWQKHRLNRHVVKWGCYWNRDILGLVERSGLRIKEIQRKHMGTTLLIVAENPA